MSKSIGNVVVTTVEQVIDFNVDYPGLNGFGSVLVYPDASMQISKNDNGNYITYDGSDKILIGGYPHLISKLYVKTTSGTANLRYWAYK